MVADERWDFMKEKLQRFMCGRYGNDRFNQFLMIVALVCLALSFFGLRIFYVLALALLVYAYYRMFSKDLSKRSAENQWYLKKEMKVRGWWQRKKRLLPVVRSTRSINARNADRRFGYPDIRGRSQSGAENAVKNLSARPDGKILWQDHGK